MTTFERIIYEGAIWSVGDPMILGLIVFVFFAGFVMLQNIPQTAKIVILSGAGILALAFMPTWVIIIFGLIAAVIVYFGLMRVTTK